MNANQLQSVSINQLSSKLKSKRELHQFLVQDCNAYLPPLQSTNVYFYKAIMRGSKEYIKRDQVLVSAVPQIEGLTVENILDLARGNQQLLNHLPDERDWVHVDRKWVCDVIYTLDRANFQSEINSAMKKRKDKLEASRDLLVDMRPEFVQALQGCLNFSCTQIYCSYKLLASTGRSAGLMKGSSKRKRTKEELEEVKQEEDDLKGDRQSFLQEFKRLKTEKSVLEAQVAMYSLSQSFSSVPQSAQASKDKFQNFNI